MILFFQFLPFFFFFLNHRLKATPGVRQCHYSPRLVPSLHLKSRLWIFFSFFHSFLFHVYRPRATGRGGGRSSGEGASLFGHMHRHLRTRTRTHTRTHTQAHLFISPQPCTLTSFLLCLALRTTLLCTKAASFTGNGVCAFPFIFIFFFYLKKNDSSTCER